MHANQMSLVLLAMALIVGGISPTSAATHKVPQDHKTIQAAIDVATAGDIVLVGPGTYQETIRLKPKVTVKSVGDDEKGKLGLARAEATILDGGGTPGKEPGVAMAEGATLDGFTVRNVGKYDDAKWQKHYDTYGEEQSHEHIGEPGVAGISVIGVTCTVTHNIVHHIGYSGIAIMGVPSKRCSPTILENVCYRNMGGGIGSMKKSTATIVKNVCFENFYAGIGHDDASPTVIENTCYGNVRAGIGISEGSKAIVRRNKCFHNRRAGIGIRTGKETQPIVEHNECYENEMAGIGNKDDAQPIIRFNRCYKNKMAGIGTKNGAQPIIADNECFENVMAGIGSRDGARPVIVGNHSHKNKMAGIGVRGKESVAVIVGNKCLENRLVAIGLPDGATAYIHGNELRRTGGGAPPLVAIKGDSSGVFSGNRVAGGGVAGVLVQGTVQVLGNHFTGRGPKQQGSAVWVWDGSTVLMSNNRVDGYRNAINASNSQVTATGNTISDFQGAAIIVRKPSGPAHVVGNTALSSSPKDQAATVEGDDDAESQNVVIPPEKHNAQANPARRLWPLGS